MCVFKYNFAFIKNNFLFKAQMILNVPFTHVLILSLALIALLS